MYPVTLCSRAPPKSRVSYGACKLKFVYPRPMPERALDIALLSSVAEQLMSAEKVRLGAQTFPVQRTSRHRFRCVKFSSNGAEYEAIEQNASKPSRWGALARAGHRVVQFRDVRSDRYVAVSVDGKVTLYSGR